MRREGVVNAASQRPAAVGGAIARGSLISIYGVRFAAGIPANRVTLTSSGRPRSLALLHADPHHLEAWIPPDVPVGPARLTVAANGLESTPQAVTILKSAPGLFSANGQGWGPARSTNGPANSLSPGGRLTLFATGLAPADRPEIRIGNTLASVVSKHLASAPAYTSEITIQTPLQTPEGCYVPVYARVPGAPPSNTVTISVHRGGGACVDPPDDLAAGWNGGRTAILFLSRTLRRTLDARQDRVEDELNAGFFDVPPGSARANPLLLLPPPGSCTTWAGAVKANTQLGGSMWDLLFSGMPGAGLDAGTAIAIRTRTVQLTVPFVSGAVGLYRRMFSGGAGRLSPRRISLDSGRLGIAGWGGAQVGPFAVALPAPVPFTALNPPAEPILRAQSLSVEWQAADSDGAMAIVLYSADANLNVAALTYCDAPAREGKFTIPAALMSQLPAGRGDLVMASWWGQTISPAPNGIGRMMALSAFARSSEVRIE